MTSLIIYFVEALYVGVFHLIHHSLRVERLPFPLFRIIVYDEGYLAYVTG